MAPFQIVYEGVTFDDVKSILRGGFGSDAFKNSLESNMNLLLSANANANTTVRRRLLSVFSILNVTIIDPLSSIPNSNNITYINNRF